MKQHEATYRETNIKTNGEYTAECNAEWNAHIIIKEASYEIWTEETL